MLFSKPNCLDKRNKFETFPPHKLVNGHTAVAAAAATPLATVIYPLNPHSFWIFLPLHLLLYFKLFIHSFVFPLHSPLCLLNWNQVFLASFAFLRALKSFLITRFPAFCDFINFVNTEDEAKWSPRDQFSVPHHNHKMRKVIAFCWKFNYL